MVTLWQIGCTVKEEKGSCHVSINKSVLSIDTRPLISMIKATSFTSLANTFVPHHVMSMTY